MVLIDYPGMNWWIARRAKAHGIPVFYYAPPQVWAWAQWRVRKMRRLVDHVLCCLPFEEECSAGTDATRRWWGTRSSTKSHRKARPGLLRGCAGARSAGDDSPRLADSGGDDQLAVAA